MLLHPVKFILILLLVSVVSLMLFKATHAATIKELNAQRDTLAREIDRNQKEAAAKKQQAQALANELKSIDGDISSTQSKISQTQDTIKSTLNSIDDLTKSIAGKENDLAVEYNNQREAIRTIYETTQQNPAFILTGEDVSESFKRSAYLESLETSIELTIDQITRLRNDLVGKKKELVTKQDNLKKVEDQQRAYKKGLDQQKNQKSNLLSDTKAAQADLTAKIAEAKKLNSQIEAQINALARASVKKGGQIKSKDAGTSAVGFIWPIDYDYTTTEFGRTDSSYPFHDAAPFHYGLDVVNRACGSPVYAAADGVANLFVSSSGYGNYIIIGHNARFTTLYGHLQSFAVSDGSEVKKGQVIGYEGTTGWSTGCHVHFEVWENGERKSPRLFLP